MLDPKRGMSVRNLSILAIIVLGIVVLTLASFLPKKISKTMTANPSSVIEKGSVLGNDYRLNVMASVSHVERSIEILKFAYEKIGTNYASEQSLKDLINQELDNAGQRIYFIDSVISSKGLDPKLKENSLNNLNKENLLRSIKELEEKVALLNNVLEVPSATEELLKK